MSMWTLEDGLAVVRSLQPLTRQFNYHVALGGGVLNQGYSDKDLDLYFLPLGHIKPKEGEDWEVKVKENADKLLNFLEGMWGRCEPIGSGGTATTDEWMRVIQPNGEHVLINRISGREIPYSFSTDYLDEHDKVIHRVKFIRPDDRIDVFIF